MKESQSNKMYHRPQTRIEHQTGNVDVLFFNPCNGRGQAVQTIHMSMEPKKYGIARGRFHGHYAIDALCCGTARSYLRVEPQYIDPRRFQSRLRLTPALLDPYI
jgi:hypothetical protein